MAAQIPFDMPALEAFQSEDYLVTESNAAAARQIDRWPDWGAAHCSILYGAAGCGKTHLSHVWQKKTGARYESRYEKGVCPDLTVSDRCLILDDIDRGLGAGAVCEESLFHLYNRQKEEGGSLLLTARQHPKFWPVRLADLRSRILAGVAIEIRPPDDPLLAAVLIKQFMDRQVTVPLAVIHFLVPRMERSFASARDLVQQIDALALSRQQKITIPLIRHLFDE